MGLGGTDLNRNGLGGDRAKKEKKMRIGELGNAMQGQEGERIMGKKEIWGQSCWESLREQK